MYSAKAVPVFCAIYGLLVKYCYSVGVSEKLMWQEAKLSALSAFRVASIPVMTIFCFHTGIVR